MTVCLLTAAIFCGVSALMAASAQQLDTELFPAGRPAAKKAPGPLPTPVPMLAPAAGKAAFYAGTPLAASVTKTLYLPPAMYGQWNITGTLLETDNPDYFPPTIQDLWTLERVGDQVVVTNPVTGGSAAVNVERVEDDTATFHTEGLRGNQSWFAQTPTVTVLGDHLTGKSLNRVGFLRKGIVTRHYYGVYRLEASRIGAARVQFRPEETISGPQIEIEEVQRGDLH